MDGKEPAGTETTMPYSTDIFQYDAADYGPKNFTLEENHQDVEHLIKNIDVRGHVVVGFGNPVQFESREQVVSYTSSQYFVTEVITKDIEGQQRVYVWEDSDCAFYEYELGGLVERRRLRVE